VRTDAHKNTLGNQLTAMRGPLPVYIHDPVSRLAFVRRAMDGLKESKQAVGAATLAAVNDLAPPTILAEASRLNFSTRLFNLLVTNIPGPQIPLYVLGRQLEDLFPLAFLPKNHALAVAIMSYNGGLDYGLLGDYDALPDIDLIADGIEASLQELLDAAHARSNTATANGDEKAPGEERRRNGGPTQILPTAGPRPRQGPAADMRAKRAKRSGRPPSQPSG
jgi:diacylglycerol O-acyltransferase / wax synthase